MQLETLGFGQNKNYRGS